MRKAICQRYAYEHRPINKRATKITDPEALRQKAEEKEKRDKTTMNKRWKDAKKAIRAALQDEQWGYNDDTYVAACYTDNAKQEQEYLMRVYGPLVHGTADIFHLIQLFGREVSKKSPHASALLSQLADVFFVRDSSDKERELDKLAASNGYARVKEGDGKAKSRQQHNDENMLLNTRRYRYRVRRYLREEHEIVQLFEEMYTTYSRIPGVFKNASTVAVCRENILSTIKQGHVTDVNVRRSLYTNLGTAENLFYVTSRSTSQLETFHRYVRAFAQGSMNKDTLIDLLRRFIFEWNISRARERTNTTGIGKYCVDIGLINDVACLLQDLNCKKGHMYENWKVLPRCTADAAECAKLDAMVVAEVSSTHGAKKDFITTLASRASSDETYDSVMIKYQAHSNRGGAPERTWPISTLQEQKLFNLFLSDHISQNAEAQGASDQVAALLSAHLNRSENPVLFFELLYAEESIKWDDMRLQWNAATLDGAWDGSGEFKVKSTTFNLSNVAPKTTKNLQEYAKDLCLRVIHCEDVTLFQQGSIVTPVEVAYSSTNPIHEITAEVDVELAYCGAATMVNPTVPHQLTNTSMSNQAGPQPINPSSFTECPGCYIQIAVGARAHDADCPVVYLKKKYTSTIPPAPKPFKIVNKCSVVRCAMSFFASLDGSQQKEWQSMATRR